MRKIMLFALCTITIYLSGCSLIKVEYYSETYFGVAEYITVNEQEILVANLGPFGIVNVSSFDSVNDHSSPGTNGSIYTIKEGDLISFFFYNVGEVSIQESYPGNFSQTPTAIDVWQHDVLLTRYDESNYELSISSSNFESLPTMDDLSYSIIYYNDDKAKLYEGSVTHLSDDSVSFLIPNDDFNNVMSYVSYFDTFSLVVNDAE